ncbi:MAG: glycosyltransferase family 2 protein [Gaiellaceae bacterium]
MKLVMTLLVRDEADIVDAQVAFHLSAGVDFVVATDNRSEDGTNEILERYAREGHLHLIREPGDDLRQSEWVTRMARLAATDFGADWVLNADADEFWWPQGAGLKDVLAVVPRRYGVVRAAWRNFVPRPGGGGLFAERMTVRLCTPAFHHHPLSTHSKSAHRGVQDVRIGRGNHEAFGEGLLPLRGWYPFEILHFPVRSLEHCVRKYVTQFVALEKNAEKGIPNHMADAYRAYRAGRLEEFYAPLVVEDDELERGLADGTYAVDTRLRDVLRELGFGDRSDSGASAREFGRPDVAAAARYAAESTALSESDLFLALGARVEDLESRVGRLERGTLTRVGGALRRGRRP